MIKHIVIACSALVVIFIGYSIYQLNTTIYQTKPFNRSIFSPQNTVLASKSVFSSKNYLSSPSEITVKQIHSGDLQVPLSNPLNLKHPSSVGLKDENITIPVFAYLIHHEKYGYFLIDSGCEASYVNKPYGTIKGLILPFVMVKTTLKSENSIDIQISKEINDLKGVFFTHMHFDHTSGLKALPDKLMYIADKRDKFINIKWLLESDHFSKSDIVYALDFNSDLSQELPLGKAIDIFGDQSLWAVSTPGHSKGHISFLVNTKEQPVLITGDAVNLKRSLELGVGPGSSSDDIDLAQKTFETISDFIKKNPDVKVFLGHDYY